MWWCVRVGEGEGMGEWEEGEGVSMGGWEECEGWEGKRIG